MTRQLMTTIDDSELEKILRARYSGEFNLELRENVPLNQGKRHFLLSCYVWQDFIKMRHYINTFNPLKMELLFAIIIGFIGTAVSYSTFWGAVAFLCILSFRMG